MNVVLPLSLAAALAAAPVFADCTPPQYAITVPDGAKAAKEELLAVQHALKETDELMNAFATCLGAELDAKIAAGGDKMTDKDRLKISADYAELQNAEVTKLQKVADQFNLAVRAYKAKMAATAPAATPPRVTPPATQY
jgi:hypothetical protein